MEARYFNALAATARCSAGEFNIAGKSLVPLSLTHQAILDGLDIPLWSKGVAADNTEYLTLALICSKQGAAGLPDVIAFSTMPEEQRGKTILALMEAFDPDTADATLAAYLEACHGSRPMLRAPDSTSFGTKFNAPFEEFVTAFILRECNGYSREQLMERMPCSLVFWIFETIREQSEGRSLIYPEADKAKDDFDNLPEEKEKRAAKNKVAQKIFSTVMDPKKRTELLGQNLAGTLPKDWLKRHRKGAKK
jgi:hypothetical protein